MIARSATKAGKVEKRNQRLAPQHPYGTHRARQARARARTLSTNLKVIQVQHSANGRQILSCQPSLLIRLALCLLGHFDSLRIDRSEVR